MSVDVQYIEAPLGQTAVLDQGDGASGSVLLIHGLSYPHQVWGPLSQRLLASGYRVISYDLYGRGQSQFSSKKMTVQDLSLQAISVCFKEN